MIGIYKITSPSKKIYIGQSIDIEKRWFFYKKLHCKKQVKLYHSFLKYGVNKHKFEIVQLCEKEQLNELEKYYVDLFQTFNNKYGLNLQDGGGANASMSEETKIKIGLANKGRIISYEMINDYTKDKSIPVMQFDRKGNFISEYRSINYAATITKIDSVLIRNCCINELYQTKGFIFILKHEFTNELLQSKISKLKNRWKTRDRTMFHKKVNMYDLNGNFIKQYNSINDAVDDGYGHVGEVCSGKRKSTNNKIFKYEKE